jgi:exopolysaccharide biosynthesis predicted pyruvyltransferase EpsI
VYLLYNTGNWGDALIRFGTEKFLNDWKIPYQRIYPQRYPFDRLKYLKGKIFPSVLLCIGGGAWCGHYPHMAKAVATISARHIFDKIIVLPSTYDRTFDIPGVIFFRRDQMQSRDAMPSSIFCHDLAFYIGRLNSLQPTQHVIHCFRTDIESANVHILPIGNRDLSNEGIDTDDVTPFFRTLESYSEVHTDRLHIGIGTALLGRKLHLYPGKYFKNRAIYRASLQPYFENVVWNEHSNQLLTKEYNDPDALNYTPNGKASSQRTL